MTQITKTFIYYYKKLPVHISQTDSFRFQFFMDVIPYLMSLLL